ncbi:HNH endonuclease [Pseudomonas syringae group genomosp. 3]|uniref:HNH endonuclease n=1 Tax=Pseudomonas syringae group genomosp. 3 TaxID=251701 RepID=UPI0015E38BC6
MVAARIGQGVFKDRIYEFEKSCRLTKVSTPNLLIASHIKPWRLCTTAFERLDGANGLLLTPHVDFLFDRGYISFNDNGAVLVSDRVNLNDFKLLGLDLARGSPCFDFHPRQLKYIKFHRDSIFMN